MGTLFCYRSIFQTDGADEGEIVQPFSRADILYNRNVDQLATHFDPDFKGLHKNMPNIF